MQLRLQWAPIPNSRIGPQKMMKKLIFITWGEPLLQDLHLKVTVSIPDIAICIAVHSMNASLSQGNNSCSLLTKCKGKR